MTGQPTRLEAGRGVVLVWCQDCPPWRRLAADRAEGYRLAADHLLAVHGDYRHAGKRREQANAADTPTGPDSRR